MSRTRFSLALLSSIDGPPVELDEAPSFVPCLPRSGDAIMIIIGFFPPADLFGALSGVALNWRSFPRETKSGAATAGAVDAPPGPPAPELCRRTGRGGVPDRVASCCMNSC